MRYIMKVNVSSTDYKKRERERERERKRERESTSEDLFVA